MLKTPTTENIATTYWSKAQNSNDYKLCMRAHIILQLRSGGGVFRLFT